MARGSNYSSDLAEICADAYKAGTEECSQHNNHHCQITNILQEHADTCQQMASA